MVFQDYKLLYDRNLFENVALPLHVLGYSGREIPDRVEEALELVIMVGITLFMIRTNWRISRAEGILLVVINLVRWYFDFAS